MISLACVNIPFKAFLNVFDCLISGRIGAGKYVKKLEEKAQKYFGVRYAIAVANGTLADIILLATLKELYPGKDEVILPSLTFIAQANAVKWAGLKPVFVDVGTDYQMDSALANKAVNEKTLCIFPVHLLGITSRASMRLARNTTPIIEDCCEAMGGNYDFPFKKLGTLGLASAFSMYPSHTITTGEGGLILTNDSRFEMIARSIANHGKIASDFDFIYQGINAKMTNLQAAIGCELIDTIDEVNHMRKENVDVLSRRFGEKDYKCYGPTAPHCFPIIFKDQEARDRMLMIFKMHDIECRKLMGCVACSKPFNNNPEECSFPMSHSLANRGLFVPIHQKMTLKQLDHIYQVYKINAR